MGFGVKDLEPLSGSGSWFYSGFRVKGSGVNVWGLGFKVQVLRVEY